MGVKSGFLLSGRNINYKHLETNCSGNFV